MSWTLDSGASYHMTHNKKCLHNIRKHYEIISFADGGTVRSECIGTYIGYINENKIVLKNVLYIPSFKRNLMSIHQLCNQFFKILFYNYNDINKVAIYDKNKNRICTTNATNYNVYKIYSLFKKPNFNKAVSKCDSIQKLENEDVLKLWHRRLAHFNITKIKDRLPNILINEKCKVCSESKLRNFPYYLSENKTKDIFELIHMDTVQYLDESLYGNKYFFSIMDDYSRYGWVFCVKSKVDIYPTFIKWYNIVKNVFNKTIKYIKTDNGGEFNNYQFNLFCENNGIIKLNSIEYNPQENGKAERFQETLIHAARALLNDARLNYKFWEDAIKTANYIHNRLPHRGNDNKIPYEILNKNKKVDFNKLKVFGCQVFFYIPKQFRKKYENSTHPGIFIGYDQNPAAYRIYDKINNKVVLARAVEFFEETPGSLNGPSSVPNIINLSNIEEEKDRVDFHNYCYYDDSDNIVNLNNTNNNDTNNENNNIDINNNTNNKNNDNNIGNDGNKNSDNNKILNVPFEVPSNDFQNNNNNLNYNNFYPNNLNTKFFPNNFILNSNKIFQDYNKNFYNYNDQYFYPNPFYYNYLNNFIQNYNNLYLLNPHIIQNGHFKNLENLNHQNYIQNESNNYYQNEYNCYLNSNNSNSELCNNLNNNLINFNEIKDNNDKTNLDLNEQFSINKNSNVYSNSIENKNKMEEDNKEELNNKEVTKL